MPRPIAPIVCLVSLVALSCGGDVETPGTTRLPSPAAAGASAPYLVQHGESTHMSWIEPLDEGGGRLLTAAWDGRRWSEPQLVTQDPALLVNWADFPSLAFDARGLGAAQWLVRTGEHAYAYEARFGFADGSGGWSEGRRPHDDTSAAEHGFVSLIPEGDGALGIVWLDGRELEGPRGTMQLLYRRWSGERLLPEVVLDDDVCTCCQTSAVRVGEEIVVAYRDHAAGEIRDISVVRRAAGGWSEPQTLHADGWKFAGCPVNGPALAERDGRIAAAWFTSPGNEPRVLVSLSEDGGATFGDPVRVDDGNPLGRVDVELLADGRPAVSWLESAGGSAEVRVRALGPGPELPTPVQLARVKAGRVSGFPRMATDGRRLFVAWTEPGRTTRVHVAAVDF